MTRVLPRGLRGSAATHQSRVPMACRA
jgi:hypothetical protein